ncbi:hypothetical protein [Streptomyces sp. NPDC005799]|uniref:hypothetical protein n=1 Tax=Streptomyces sp. NPDC005799 TaxID=3154678 RepID=UPI0033DA78E3
MNVSRHLRARPALLGHLGGHVDRLHRQGAATRTCMPKSPQSMTTFARACCGETLAPPLCASFGWRHRSRPPCPSRRVAGDRSPSSCCPGEALIEDPVDDPLLELPAPASTVVDNLMRAVFACVVFLLVACPACAGD